jgi:DNA repair protein RAD50
MYADADSKFRSHQIKLTTTELSCADLQRYYQALDRAVMSFHKMKMEEINKIIKELWMATYQGNGVFAQRRKVDRL